MNLNERDKSSIISLFTFSSKAVVVTKNNKGFCKKSNGGVLTISRVLLRQEYFI